MRLNIIQDRRMPTQMPYLASVVEFPMMNHVLRLAIKYHIACQEIVCIRHREIIHLFLNCVNVCQTHSHLIMQLLQLYRDMFNCGHS